MNRITHIRKPNTNSTVDHITDVKGVTDDGRNFEITVPKVIEYLKTGQYVFYVQVGQRRINVTYQKSASGREYIKTEPDSTTRDNLLSLPQF